MPQFAILISLVLALVAGCASIPKVDSVYQANLTFETRAKRVMIVSFDGLRPDAIEPGNTPHLSSMKAFGAYAESAKSVLPSITLVNHASMISGVGPGKHGIDWNEFLPESGTLGVPTVFDLAKKRGLATAMVAGKDKFNHLNRPGTIDHFVIEKGSASDVAIEALRILKEHRPEMMLVHFRHPDSAGHADGWLSPSQLEAINEADQAFGYLMQGIKTLGMLGDTAVIATADHGGSGHGHGGSESVEMTIPWIAAGPEVTVHGEINKPVTTFDTAATAVSILDIDVPGEWDGTSVF